MCVSNTPISHSPDVMNFRNLLCISTLLIQPISVTVAQTNRADSARFQNHRYNEFFHNNRDPSYISPNGELGAPGKYVINGELIASYFLLSSPNSRVSVAVILAWRLTRHFAASLTLRNRVLNALSGVLASAMTDCAFPCERAKSARSLWSR